MKARIITGLLLATGVIVLLMSAPAWAAYLLFQIAAVIMADEFYRMTLKDGRARDRVAGVIVAAGLVAVQWFAHDWTLFAAYGGVLLLIAVVLFSEGDVHGMGPRAGMLLAGLAYVGLLTTSMVGIIHEWQEPRLVLVLFAGVFAGDTGAFFAGKFLGKKKLYEKISPKKTWAGAWGGAVGSIGGVFGLNAAAGTGIPPEHCLALGIGCAVLEQVGDLAESLFKRAYDVKDSGTLLPGHGGLLDRVDGVLFAAPFFWGWLHAFLPGRH